MSTAANSANSLVYSPRSLAEALALFVTNPDAQLFAGGTAWQAQTLSTTIQLPPVTISLHLTDDLKRVTFGERTLDLGSALTLNQLLASGVTRVPVLLKLATRVIGTSALRNLATLGGNLCQREVLGDLFTPLHLLGAQLEVRNLRGSRWVSTQAVTETGSIGLAAGEILTKIRLPFEEWPLSFYHKIGNIRTPWDERLALSTLARTKNGQLEALRLAFHLPHAGVIRVREWEAEMVGLSLPLSVRIRSQALERIDAAVMQLTTPASRFQRDRILHMTKWVLTRLDDE